MLAHNKGTPKYIKQLLMSQQNGEIYSNTLIVGDFTNSLYQWIYQADKKVNKETSAVNKTLD